MSDYCYSFPVFRRVLDRADLMDRVMARVGTDRLHAMRADEGVAWYEARSRCIACTADNRCRTWLDAQPDSSGNSPPPFCPNAAFLADFTGTRRF